MSFFTDLAGIAGEADVRFDVPASALTTFRAGGPVACLVTPRDADVLASVLAAVRAEGCPYFLLGRGSNLLVGDGGYPGVMISMRQHLSHVRTEGCVLHAEGGAMMSDCAKQAYADSLAGFEFASGIPGTIGGGLYMNAGAYGSELSDSVLYARVLMPDGEVRTFTGAMLGLSYRHSVLQENGGIVLEAAFRLRPGKQEDIRALMEDLASRRREKQPLEYASAGSTFKRPAGYFAGKLIEEAGLKGFRIGDAGVSEKHAGFVVNYGHASAREIRAVMDHTAEAVYGHSGVMLEPEVRMIGVF
ncbi:MAG: UDP-N-acetylmuramate dehydrogenase [Lachnospiraceae bacterium]|nr:UDP-N-acetylmuramate dehydrogenase [Lachnospiraceae bacterium]